MGIVKKVQIVNNGHGGYPGSQTQPTIGREEQIGFVFSKYRGHSPIEKQIPKYWVPGLGVSNHRSNIGTKQKFLTIWPVEDKNKFVLGVLLGNTAQGFAGKPSNAFELSG